MLGMVKEISVQLNLKVNRGLA